MIVFVFCLLLKVIVFVFCLLLIVIVFVFCLVLIVIVFIFCLVLIVIIFVFCCFFNLHSPVTSYSDTHRFLLERTVVGILRLAIRLMSRETLASQVSVWL